MELDRPAQPGIVRMPIRYTERAYMVTRKQCSQCHKQFVGTERKVYCGRPCRARAYYERSARTEKRAA